MPIRVLFVCTGNVCRSPAAELLARRAFAEAGIDAVVSSAGVRAMVGHPVHGAVAHVLAERGIDPAHTARDIDPRMVADADLILTMTREHRSEVVRIDARARGRTFTLREFTRLAPRVETDGAGIADLPAWLARVVRQRGMAPGEDDIEDPLTAEEAGFTEMVELIEAEVGHVAEPLRRVETSGG